MFTADGTEEEIRRLRQERLSADSAKKGIAFGGSELDDHIYGGGGSKGTDFVDYLPAPGENEERMEIGLGSERGKLLSSYTAPKQLIDDVLGVKDGDEETLQRRPRIVDRENDYKLRRFNRIISPERVDAFSDSSEQQTQQGPSEGRSYKDALIESQLAREESEVRLAIKKKMLEKEKDTDKDSSEKDRSRERDDRKESDRDKSKDSSSSSSSSESRKRKRWDEEGTPSNSEWDKADSKEIPTVTKSKWDDATPPAKRRNRWDETPTDPTSTATSSKWVRFHFNLILI